MDKQWVFDTDFTRRYTKVRQDFIAAFLDSIRGQVELKTAIDVGAGVGYFSRFLRECGLDVIGVDARSENVAEAARRHKDIRFLTHDVESPLFSDIGKFDLALCVGLLYHLENPFRAIRNLYSITEQIVMIETMYSPASEASMDLLDEGVEEDQALNRIAFYPSEPCFAKMLYSAGFRAVYRFSNLPQDPLFRNGLLRKRQRTFLVASKAPITAPNLVKVTQQFRPVGSPSDPWATGIFKLQGAFFQARVWAAKTLKPMLKSVGAKSK